MSVFLSAFILDILESNSPNKLVTRSMVLLKTLFGFLLKSIGAASITSFYLEGVWMRGVSSREETDDIRDLLSD